MWIGAPSRPGRGRRRGWRCGLWPRRRLSSRPHLLPALGLDLGLGLRVRPCLTPEAVGGGGTGPAGSDGAPQQRQAQLIVPVRPPPLLVELVESHFREGLTGNVRPVALHQPRDLRRPDCLVDVVLLVRGHTCVGNTGGERGWPTTPCLTSTNRFAVSDIGGACFQKAETAMKVKISTSGPERTAAADGLVRKRAAPS